MDPSFIVNQVGGVLCEHLLHLDLLLHRDRAVVPVECALLLFSCCIYIYPWRDPEHPALKKMSCIMQYMFSCKLSSLSGVSLRSFWVNSLISTFCLFVCF